MLIGSNTKKVVSLFLSIETSAFTGWLVKAAYDNAALSIPCSILIALIVAQIAFIFVDTHEDQELEKLRKEAEVYRREQDLLQRIKLSQLEAVLEANKETIKRIRAGDFTGAKEWEGFSR